jgi:hypothetical protein
MTDTANVTPLRKDNTAALRQRRSRAKRVGKPVTGKTEQKQRSCHGCAGAVRAMGRMAARQHNGRADGGVSHAPVGRRDAANGNPDMAGVGHGRRDRLHADLSRLGAAHRAARRQAGHRAGRAVYGSRHPDYERRSQRLGVHWWRLRRRSLGANCLRLFRSRGNQWGNVYTRAAYAAVTTHLLRRC